MGVGGGGRREENAVSSRLLYETILFYSQSTYFLVIVISIPYCIFFRGGVGKYWAVIGAMGRLVVVVTVTTATSRPYA